MKTVLSKSNVVNQFVIFESRIHETLKHCFIKHYTELFGTTVNNYYSKKQQNQISTLFINHRSIIRKVYETSVMSNLTDSTHMGRLVKSIIQYHALKLLNKDDTLLISSSREHKYYHDDVEFIKIIDEYKNKLGLKTLTNFCEEIIKIAIDKQNKEPEPMSPVEMNKNTIQAFSEIISVDNFIQRLWPNWLLDTLKTSLTKNHLLFNYAYNNAAIKNIYQFNYNLDIIINNANIPKTEFYDRNKALFRAYIIQLLCDHNAHNAGSHSLETNNWLENKQDKLYLNNTNFLNKIIVKQHINNSPTLINAGSELIAKTFNQNTNQPQQEKQMSTDTDARCGSIEKQGSHKIFEIVPTVRGRRAENLSDDELFSAAEDLENQITRAKSPKTKSKKLDAKIKQLEEELAALIKYTDERV